jgi:enoyl-CoA hydratase/carnithine racemase
MAVAVRSPDEILDALRSPYAREELVGQGPALGVDLSGYATVPDGLQPLGSLPLVVIGIGGTTAATGAGIDAFDVLLTDDATLGVATQRPVGRREPAGGDGWVHGAGGALEELGRLVQRLEARPQASVTLVQLLRLGRQVAVADALVAESLAYATLQAGEEHVRWLRARTAAPAPGSRPDAPAARLERDGEVLHVRFCRPEVHNAFGTASRDALVEALQLAAADDTIRRVRLSGEGRSFCSGGDLREFGSKADPATAHLVRTTRNPGWWLHRMAERATAELHGACIGAGIELAAFAGEVVARDDVRIRLPEIEMGLVPGAGGTVSLPRRIGRRRTAWLCLSGTTLDAERARRWGLVDRVVAADPRRDDAPRP